MRDIARSNDIEDKMADKKNGTQGAGPATATETAPKPKKLPKNAGRPRVRGYAGGCGPGGVGETQRSSIAGCSVDAGCAHPRSRRQRVVPREHPSGRRADG
jgi:hypothetical protein